MPNGDVVNFNFTTSLFDIIYTSDELRYNMTMENLRQLFKDNLNTEFITAILSNPRQKKGITKVKVRPLMKGDRFFFQLEEQRGTQAFHRNLSAEETCEELMRLMEGLKQMQMETQRFSFSILVSKKGKVTIKKKLKAGTAEKVDLSHDRKKRYILQEGTTIPFLVDLGVMTAEGKIVKARFDKFRQINRFLEFIEDVIPRLPRDRELTILDFGCGKSYLTFAIYYYLHELKQYDIRIIGLDLKADVIRHCNELCEKYGYTKLKFLEGNIADYTGVNAVDMVVTLHACDTATDFALAKAVEWNAEVILSVPCCQHELNGQIHSEILGPVLKYGLIKERMSALITDALRAQYLEGQGYETQILEFIDMEHTPKNILIRAVKTGQRKSMNDVEMCEKELHVSPAIKRLLEDQNERKACNGV